MIKIVFVTDKSKDTHTHRTYIKRVKESEKRSTMRKSVLTTRNPRRRKKKTLFILRLQNILDCSEDLKQTMNTAKGKNWLYAVQTHRNRIVRISGPHLNFPLCLPIFRNRFFLFFWGVFAGNFQLSRPVARNSLGGFNLLRAWFNICCIAGIKLTAQKDKTKKRNELEERENTRKREREREKEWGERYRKKQQQQKRRIENVVCSGESFAWHARLWVALFEQMSMENQ